MKHFSAKLLMATAFFCGVAFASAQADTIKVSVAAEPYPPFASKDASGQWVGFEVDLAKAVCKAAKLDCEIVATAWDGIIPALIAKKIDVIWASMTITPERSAQIGFTIRYYNTPPEFIGNKADKFDFTPEGMKGKSIGVQTSTIHAQYVQKTYPDADIKSYGTQDAANADLAAGRLDLVMADAAALDDFLAGKDGQCCEMKQFPKDPVFEAGVGGGLRKEDTDLKAKLDAGIKAVYADGEFDTIQKKYFKYDVGTPPK
ncbi:MULTISPECIES: transporter substrate-binding domain-containing protein [Labrys]|uniref:Transporter substrate-binding domain-containing protein n=1 Tax=Labrys neptuniae TaxID=376174 RepID=A0ABV3PY75_9HYPH|nr:transporter substrate-binding domain-containing protein [Labrys sp. ZIDIC5]MDZ5448147.1 transporter substrate-binding domain-containing protein [Labrys sp. ZIDIC5]